MELKHIKIFALAAEFLNFSKVAELSFISQSSVSKYIQCIEDELGGKLFMRDGRRTELTELGSLFLPYALAMLDKERESMEVIRHYQSGLQRTLLRIGIEDSLSVAPPELFYLRLVHTLQRLHSAFPGSAFDSTFYPPNQLQALYSQKQLDIIIRMISDVPDRIIQSTSDPCECLEHSGFLLLVPGNVDISQGYRHVLSQVKTFVADVTSLPQKSSSIMERQYGLTAETNAYPHWTNLYMAVALSDLPVASVIAENMGHIAEACGLQTIPMEDFPIRNGLYAFWKDGNTNPLLHPFLQKFKETLAPQQNN